MMNRTLRKSRKKKYLELNENENRMYQKLCDIMKALLREKGLRKIGKNSNK